MRLTRQNKIIALVLSAVALLLLAWGARAFYMNSSKARGDAAAADPNVPFNVVEASNRSFDGSPALALTFSQPVSEKQSFGNQIQVFEMPESRPAKAAKTAQASDEDQASGEEDDSSNNGSGQTPVEKSVSTDPKDVEVAGGKALNGAWVVGENPRMLFLPNVKPRTRYVVTVKTGLRDTGGRTLASEARYSVTTAAIAPAYYFASNGMVLPAKQNGGLPVVTVNVPEVDVQFLKVRKAQMPRFLEMVIKAKKVKKAKKAEEEAEEENEYNTPYDKQHHALHGAVSNWELDPLHQMTDSVYQGRFVTEQKKNRQSVTFIPVEDIKELKEPGIYVAVMSKPGRFRYDYQTTYFYVSDLGLSLHVYPGGATALVSSLVDAKAVGGVNVSWMDAQGKVLAHAETDSLGRADFTQRPEKARIVLAEKDGQMSMLALKEAALDLSEYDIGGELYKPVRLFAYSGRDLYRPGESFEVSIVARDADGHPVPAQPIQAILRRPDGHNQLVSMLKPDAKRPGYYQQHVDVPTDAPTGAWTLELRNDPADKQPNAIYRFSAEEFLPERMKLDLASAQANLKAKEPLGIDVTGAYLYGAPASGNRLLGVVEYYRNLNPLSSKLPGYVFGNIGDDKVASRKDLEETALDEAGKAHVNVDTSPADQLSSPVAIRATLSLLETGGRPVVRNIERTVWPAAALMGMRPKFSNNYVSEDSLAEFDVVYADQNAQMLPARGVQVRLIRENRSWYWRYDDQRGWNSGFTETSELVGTYRLDLSAGKPEPLKVPVKYGAYRLEVVNPDSPLVASYRFYAGWSAQRDQTDGVRPDRVSLKLDKPVYRDGDTAHLTIAAPHRGEAIVAVEGDKMLWMKRISLDSDSQTIDIPFDAGWKRQDLYASVTVLRPGNQGDGVTPTRALGLIHMGLDRTDRRLAVSINAPDKVRPDTKVSVRVNAPGAQGKQAIVTLSAVDEGILNITNFKTPDPHAYFFGQLRFGPDLHDIYGRLIEKMAGNKGKLKFGGDTSLKQPRKTPQKVKLVDLFSGPVQLDAKGGANITLNVPDFNGRLRLMAVVSAPEQFGSSEKSMTVAAPLIAEINTPRFLALGDSATIALDLHNLSGGAQNLKVSVTTGGNLTLQNGSRTVALKDQEKTTLRFGVTASGGPDMNDLRVLVEGKDLRIDRHFILQTEAPTPPQHVNSLLVIEPGKSVALSNIAPNNWYPGATAQITLSTLPPVDIRRAVQGLLHYPYGCAEQTTSSSYPWLFVDEEAARRWGLPVHSHEERVAVLEKSFAKLGAYQAPNGGFSLWGNANEYDYWLTAYVTEFLQDARAQGFSVPDAMYDKAIAYLQKEMPVGIASLPSNPGKWNGVSGWDNYWSYRNRNFDTLARGAMVLANDRKVTLATLRQLYDLRANANTGLALVELGIALQTMGDAARAKTVLAEGLAKPRIGGDYWYDYGSDVRDSAMIYALVRRHKITVPGLDGLLPQIADSLKSRQYLSTQEQLAVFLAARDLDSSPGKDWSAKLNLRGAEQALQGNSPLYRSVESGDLNNGSLQNTGATKLFAVVSVSGYPKQMPDNKSPITVSHRYFRADGSALDLTKPLKVGETIWVQVRTNAEYFTPNGLVVDRIPAGIEIENTNIVQGEKGATIKVDGLDPVQAMTDSRIDHVEFRDDRFVAAVRLGRWWNGDLVLFYRARVVTPGRFVIPPSYVEDMYKPTVYGVGKSGETLVVEDARAPASAPIKSENDVVPANPPVQK
jgi:hypothetical protein